MSRRSSPSVTGGVVYTVQQMGVLAKQSAVALVTLPVKVWGVAEAIVGVKDRAQDSPVSIVGGGRIAGETASEDGFPLQDKLVFLLSLVAGFNLFIGLFNFIPLLPARRRPHRGRALGGGPPRASPGCAVAPTPATSTWPGCFPSRTSWPASCS